MGKEHVVFKVGVQSYSDIITNSSSELFVVRNDKVVDEDFLESLENFLIQYSNTYDLERGSGDARDITVYQSDDLEVSEEESVYQFCIMIDRDLENTINYIVNELKPIDSWSC